MINIQEELEYKTSRSGGKGGQNVNKVETQVEARWHIPNSSLVNDEQKKILLHKLVNKINNENQLVVKCSEKRTQLENKELVTKKINTIVNKALIKPKPRKKTTIPKVVKEKIKQSKIHQKLKKEGRRKIMGE